MKDKTGKIIKTVSLDNMPELVEHINKQGNFSNYVQRLLQQDMARLQQTIEANPEKIELTRLEKYVYSCIQCYAREYGGMEYANLYRMFDLQPEPELLQCLLLDVQDRNNKAPEVKQFIENLREDEKVYSVWYEKMRKYWRQQNPIPEDWKKEIVPGLTLHEALAKIIPKALSVKDKGNSLTVKRISEILGLTYQQTYLQLIPCIQPVLRELQIEV